LLKSWPVSKKGDGGKKTCGNEGEGEFRKNIKEGGEVKEREKINQKKKIPGGISEGWACRKRKKFFSSMVPPRGGRFPGLQSRSKQRTPAISKKVNIQGRKSPERARKKEVGGKNFAKSQGKGSGGWHRRKEM